MKRRHILLLYQLLIGASDTATGLLLLAAPALTLRLMNLDPPDSAALPYLSYVGAFVLSVGLACLYGAWLVAGPRKVLLIFRAKMQVVWLLTGITRALVAAFVLAQVFHGTLETGWLTVAASDGILALIQFTGLAQGWFTRGWLSDVLS